MCPHEIITQCELTYPAIVEVFHLTVCCNQDENNPSAWSNPRASDFIGMRCRLDVGVLKDPRGSLWVSLFWSQRHCLRGLQMTGTWALKSVGI